MLPSQESKPNKALRFIHCKIMCYPVTEPFGYKLCIFAKPLYDLRIHPASLFVDFIGEFPVIQSNVRFNPIVQKLVDQCIIKSNSLLIYSSISIRKNSCPVNGETISLQSHLFHDFYIFRISVVMITGCFSCMVFKHMSRLFCIDIPDVFSLSFAFYSTFYLIGTGCSSSCKIFSESHNRFSSSVIW